MTVFVGTGAVPGDAPGLGTVIPGDLQGQPNPGAGQGVKWTGSAWVPVGNMEVDLLNPPRTLYVDHVNGSDSNKGASPGQPLLTLKAAIDKFLVAQQNGEVRMIDSGAYRVPAPLHCAGAAVTLRGNGPQCIELWRDFDTPNGRTFLDPVTTAAGSQVQSATAAFTSADQGRIISVYGAGFLGGTFYGFITTVPDGTHANLDCTTALARVATEKGAKGQVVGDWNRVVTDASITHGQSVVTSATANWTSADLNTELVIAGAGKSGQALRGVIIAVAGNQATILGQASTDVTNARCAIGVNFGDLLVQHTGGGGLRGCLLRDNTTGRNRIGSLLKVIADDGGAGTQQNVAPQMLEHIEFTSVDPAGAVEHMIDIDGTWAQTTSGPGVRRNYYVCPKVFGTRIPTQTIRIAGACHAAFVGGGLVGSAPVGGTAQGIMILDPRATGGDANNSVDQISFAGFEGFDAYFYCEGKRVTYYGTIGAIDAVAGRRTIEFGPTSQDCLVIAVNATTLTGVNADEYDAGVRNRIETTKTGRKQGEGDELTVPTTFAGGIETFARRRASNASQAVGSSGVLVCQSLPARGGFPITKLGLLIGGTGLTWGSGWTGQHFIFGIVDPDLNLFGQSNDTGGTQVAGASGIVSLPITKDGSGAAASTVRVPRTGVCYIVLLINSGTGGSGFVYPNFGGMANVSASLSPVLCGTSGSGLTALPTTITTPTGVSSQLAGGVA